MPHLQSHDLNDSIAPEDYHLDTYVRQDAEHFVLRAWQGDRDEGSIETSVIIDLDREGALQLLMAVNRFLTLPPVPVA